MTTETLPATPVDDAAAEACFIRPKPGAWERAKKIKFDPVVSEEVWQFIQDMGDRELEAYDRKHAAEQS